MFVNVLAKHRHNGNSKATFLQTNYIMFAYEDDGQTVIQLQSGDQLYMKSDEWLLLKDQLEAEQRRQSR